LIVAASGRPGETLICFSHLRWDFVFQRPQHLMSRFARSRRVFYFEEPLGLDTGQTEADLWIKPCERTGVIRVVPRIPTGLDDRERDEALRGLLDGLIAREQIRRPVVWYYTPMMLNFSRHLQASAVVYDCMDELANFKGAPKVADRAGARAVQPRRPGHHRRLEPVRGQEGAARQCARLPLLGGPRAPGAGAHLRRRRGAPGPGRPAPPADGLLRRHRRADGSWS
jgi:hypothetical protein